MKYDPNSLEFLALPVEERVRLRAEALIERNVPERYRNLSMSDFPEKKKWADLIIQGSSGLIFGDNGVGKTAFITAMYMELLRRGESPVILIGAPSLMEQLNKDVAAGSLLKSVIEMEWGRFVPRLFIDELDKVRYTEASFQNLFALIDYRYQWNLQTVCVANGNKEEITKKVPQAVLSRLTGDAEGNFGVMFGGKDKRRS